MVLLERHVFMPVCGEQVQAVSELLPCGRAEPVADSGVSRD